MNSPARMCEAVTCITCHSYLTRWLHPAGISEAQSNVDRLRQILESVTSGVQEGRAEQQHQRQLALSRRQKPVPYSPWLSQPFLKVCSFLFVSLLRLALQSPSGQSAQRKHDLPCAYLAHHN